MTVAVCYKCGAMKFGAFSACKQCGAMPSSEDDYALSLSITDHYFDISTLEEMGRNIAIGTPPHLDPESRRNLIQMIIELCKSNRNHIIPMAALWLGRMTKATAWSV